jgi:YegS/Rv2252/BmrU family lipid kinase
VLWNPNAGTKAGIPTNSVSEAQLRDVMARHGLGDELIATGSEEHAIKAAADAVAAGYDVVAGAGGDGTIGAIAFQLLRSRTALGILPSGSAMNVARSLGIPRELDPAAAIVATGPIRTIDVGQANGQAFLEVGSVGINAAVFAEAKRLDDGHVGSLVGMVGEALRFRPARMQITLDDVVVTTRALMIVVANAPYTGLGLAVAPAARLDDGLLDVRVFSGYSKLELLRYAVSAMVGRRRDPRPVRTWQSREVRVEARHPRPVRADSHDLGTTPAVFGLLPGALRVIAPEE